MLIRGFLLVRIGFFCDEEPDFGGYVSHLFVSSSVMLLLLLLLLLRLPLLFCSSFFL